jgi:PAS domain S-box-containing protein
VIDDAQSLGEKRVLLTPLFNSSKYGIAIINPEGIILGKNNAFCDTFGLKHNNLEGLSIGEIFPDTTHRIITISLGLFIKQSLEGSGEWVIPNLQNNKSMYIEYYFQLVLNDEESFIALYVNDITDRTMADRKLKEQYQLIKEYASYNSHQIRSHVARILGLSLLFNFKDLSDTNNAILVHYMHEEATKLDEVIHLLAIKTSSA